MPRFYEDVEVDIDIDVDEFLSNCDKEDIKQLIECLTDDGYLTTENTIKKNVSYMEHLYQKQCNFLKESYLSMGKEDIEIIEKIYKKYGGV